MKWGLVAALLALSAGDAARAAEPNHQFAAYPAAVYHGKAVQPGFRGAQRSYRNYRTRIRDSVKAGPGFAGHYAIAVVGCGSSCRFGFITDLTTGLIYDLPHGGEDYYEVLYRSRPDSRLLQTQWQRLDKDYNRLGCALEDFVWTGKGFRSLGVRTTEDDCPDWDDFL